MVNGLAIQYSPCRMFSWSYTHSPQHLPQWALWAAGDTHLSEIMTDLCQVAGEEVPGCFQTELAMTLQTVLWFAVFKFSQGLNTPCEFQYHTELINLSIEIRKTILKLFHQILQLVHLFSASLSWSWIEKSNFFVF